MISKADRAADVEGADPPAVWILFGARRGDNAQLLALAERLGRPYRIIQLEYTLLSLLPPQLIGAREWAVKPSVRPQLDGAEPELVIGITSRTVTAALAIRRRFGGRPKLVQLGHPRARPGPVRPGHHHSAIWVPHGPNVVRLPLPVTRSETVSAEPRERAWLDALPRPHRLLIVGGNSMWWRLRPSRLVEVFGQLARRSRKDGGSLIAVSSPRTSARVMAALVEAARRVPMPRSAAGSPRYRVLLDDADEIFVTADSASMMAEAVATGKPVGIVPIENSVPGRVIYAITRAFGWQVPMRDLTRLWRTVDSAKLAGTVSRPRAGKTDVATVDRAAAGDRAADGVDGLEARFLEPALLHQRVDLDQRREQALHAVERPGIGSVGLGVSRVGMCFHEQAARLLSRPRRARAPARTRADRPSWSPARREAGRNGSRRTPPGSRSRA